MKVKFTTTTEAREMISFIEARPFMKGTRPGSRYALEISENVDIDLLVRSSNSERIAREILGCQPEDGLRLISLTALTVDAGSSGMHAHVDYPHFFGSCPSGKPLVAQFVLSLDGTTEGRAPTWVESESNSVELEPGELLAFQGDKVHGVKPNVSDSSRTNLLWSIGYSWIKPMSKSLDSKTIGRLERIAAKFE